MPEAGIKSPSNFSVLSELSGSVGNFGTLLPLLFAISFACGLNLSLMILWAAAWYFINGIYYRLPISIEPLKGVGALAIAEHLSPDIIAAGGILVGIICFCIGLSGAMTRIKTIIPEAVIRGVQLGLAFSFIKSAASEFILPDLSFAIISAVVLILFLLISKISRIPDLSALCIMVTGFLLAIYYTGFPQIGYFSLPHLVIPDVASFISGAIILVPAQIPISLTNSILATSLLVTDLFKREVSPDKLSKTLGLMSITASISGGFPLCHGAGGLAAHYRFGARKGLALIFGSVFLFMIALLCTDSGFVSALPKGMFGILLVAVGIELLRVGLKTKSIFITALIAIISIPFGFAIAFFWGLIAAWSVEYYKKNIKSGSS